ncbi:hypothetical protein FJT64_018478 [Amphibalanus amphitrite]|uniref:Uncharacterized protein n=1 Tax=Amphibalanus amphitrite TaxID=1232801 RepID=A0A6A4X847_AMPAM|nr:hypothetical protein FJT64_018478 [Amphibalanus amphitrite]
MVEFKCKKVYYSYHYPYPYYYCYHYPYPYPYLLPLGATFKTWKTRWTDFCTLSGLAAQPSAVQLAMLRSCLSDETIHIVENMGLSREDSEDVKIIIERLERHAVGQTIAPVVPDPGQSQPEDDDLYTTRSG